MKTPKHSLRKIVSFLNNDDEDGGFWLPNIQRPFVWSEDQICRLFDSILREYPISTLLIWKTRTEIRHRKFIDNYCNKLRLSDFYVPENNKKKCLVLDGQQRLQSLFIGLRGSYEGRELFLDILSGEVSAPDDVKFKFAFLDAGKTGFPWIKFKELVFNTADPLTAAENLIAEADRELSPDERRKISRHVGIVFKTFHSDDGISYQELDSIENAELYTEDDVVEVFIRANSGGTRLGKSDLLFSLLSSSWNRADEQMDDILSDINRHGFVFTRDFVLKSCLTLLNQGARYEISKFRKPGVREEIETKWQDITKALKDVLDFVCGKTFIRCDKALPSYLVLVPLVYSRYHFPDNWKTAQGVDSYLLRTLISGAFSGTPDQLIDDCVGKIKERNGFDMNYLFDAVRLKGRSLELTEDRFWKMGYGSDSIHLLFNLWYREFNYTPAYDNNLPQVDHIFPQSALRRIKSVSPETSRLSVVKHKQDTRDQLANCMLLTQAENGAGGKSDTLPDAWFSDKPESYLNMHLIPKDKDLWKIDRFEDFIEERKKLIRDKFSYLLAQKTQDNQIAQTEQ
jgi:uncharacterized protein with ParB-like and HNH nuclease domain